MAETVKLTYQGKTYEFPVLEGTCGEKAIDISTLRNTTGLITFDPGYMSTGSCQSQITYLDGEKGVLLYRVIPSNRSPKKVPSSKPLVFSSMGSSQPVSNSITFSTTWYTIPWFMNPLRISMMDFPTIRILWRCAVRSSVPCQHSIKTN